MEFALARGAAVWRGLERGVGTFSLGNIIALRGRAADLRRTLDTVIMQADRRIDQLRQGKTQMKMPDDADWGWRPDVFATRLGQISSVVRSARHNVGTSIAVHHNDTVPIASFCMTAGRAMEYDLQAEVALLREELEILKRAFRRHIHTAD